MAKIHSIEWTPAILPNYRLDLGLNSNWYGMLTYKFRKSKDRKTVADFRVSNPELGGLVGNKLNKHGTPFGLTEEFVEVYRLHSLLPESLCLRAHATGDVIEEVPFVASRQAGSPKVTERIGMTDLFYSFGNQHPGLVGTQQLPPLHAGAEHPRQPGVRHGRRRHPAGPGAGRSPLQRVPAPARPEPDPHVRRPDGRQGRRCQDQRGLRRRRREARPAGRHARRSAIGRRGFGFGETMFQIFILNASRRLQADRFYTDDYREEVYTKEGMAWVDDSSFKNGHPPPLPGAGRDRPRQHHATPSSPGTPTPELDPERHPLRAFDPELKKDPWKGDAAPSRQNQSGATGASDAADAGSHSIQAVSPAPGDVHREGIQAQEVWPLEIPVRAITSRWNRWRRSCPACSGPATTPAPSTPRSRYCGASVCASLLLPLVSRIPAAKTAPVATRSRRPARARSTRQRYRKIWPQPPVVPPELQADDVLAALAVSGPFALYLQKASTLDHVDGRRERASPTRVGRRRTST